MSRRFSTIGQRYFNDFDMRNPAPYAERKYREAILQNKNPAAIAKWAELAVGYRSALVERERRFDKFEAFIASNLKFTDETYDSDLLEISDPGFDCYICVTDVIWQSIPTHVFDRGFMLGSKAFEGKAKIAYAASRGASKDFTDDQADIFFEYLTDFDTISVRERDFSEYIEERSDLEAPTVLDPVLFHGREFWTKVATAPRNDRYLLLYYVMEESTDTIAKAVDYAKLHDLTVIELSDRPLKHGKVSDPDVKHIARYDVGMEEWLGYIEHADAVFTNSFHGCCFALIFQRPLFVGKRNGQKVPNFLATFGLSDRQFARDVDVAELDPAIDYGAANSTLAHWRQRSEKFILDALSKAEHKATASCDSDNSKHDAKRRAIIYPVRYHSGGLGGRFRLQDSAADAKVVSKRLRSGALEYSYPSSQFRNDGLSTLEPNLFTVAGSSFAGWTMRFRIDNRWFWYLDDDTIEAGDASGSGLEGVKAVLDDLDQVPHIAVNHIGVVVFVAQWKSLDPSEGPQLAASSTVPTQKRPSFFARIRRRISRS